MVGRPPEYKPEILEKAREYLTMEDLELPSVAGLALYIGVARSTVYKWATEEDKQEFSDIVERLLAEQEKSLFTKGLKGEYNPTITKLMLTKHGYSDKQDLTSGEKPLAPLLVRFLDEKTDSGDTQ